MTKIYAHITLLVTVLVTGGCAGLSHETRPTPTAAYTACTRLFDALDQSVQNAGARDSEAAVIKGFPYLRVNRFLASFRDEILSETAFQAWVVELQTLDRTARKIEVSNLPEAERQNLRTSASVVTPVGDLNSTVQHCGDVLREADLTESTQRDRLRSAAKVPAEYKSWQRVVGIYPFTALAFAAGIRNWHNQTLEVFAKDIAALPVQGQLVQFVPPPAVNPLNHGDIAEILKRSAQNPLQIPQPNDADQATLFAAFAPTLEIDVATDDDRIGAPVWGEEAYPLIDIRQPIVYPYLSHTRVAGQNLLQINYTFWFPARPKTGALDFLGGHVDGVTWRVTLTSDGQAWVYDSIHNCGCYHLFFPTRRAQLKPQPNTNEEQAFVPEEMPTLSTGPTLRIAHQSHYLKRVLAEPTTSGEIKQYQWANYDSLRSLPVQNNERRSLFRSDGIVPGSDRLERYFFWPMGIPHPGAMRERGHHATAFVGRRHFDDPDLFEKAFELVP